MCVALACLPRLGCALWVSPRSLASEGEGRMDSCSGYSRLFCCYLTDAFPDLGFLGTESYFSMHRSPSVCAALKLTIGIVASPVTVNQPCSGNFL